MAILEAEICNDPEVFPGRPRRPTGAEMDQRLAQQCQSLITFFEATAGDRLVAGSSDQDSDREIINHLKKIFSVKGLFIHEHTTTICS